MNKTNNLRAYLRDLYEGIVSKKPDASRNPQNFRSEIEAIRTGGELYEVMDASELPEDAPNGSLALVEGEPIPEAYTVSSVDELPSNAVDGSSAFVSNNDIIGGWCINSQPNFIEEMDWYFNFTTINPDGDLSFMDNFYAESNEQTASLYYYSGETEYPAYYYNYDTPTTTKWISNGFRFITITSTPEDYAEQWVRTNAIKTKSLYTHENGQWVYKCEVV